MKHSSMSKHVLFYVVIIGSVLVLFQLVSTYGESNLKAPPNVNGRYLSASPPPGCLDGDRLVLTIQQSGIYLNGFVNLGQDSMPQNAAESESTSEAKPSLTGLWKPEQLTLAGETDVLDCVANKQSSSSSAASTVTVQGQVKADAVFTGQLSVEGSPQPWQFTAQRQAAAKPKAGH
jgi:hypothetical protein